MEEKKDDLKNTPLSNVDNSIIKPNNDNPSFKDIEEQRFTIYNPLLSDSIKLKECIEVQKWKILLAFCYLQFHVFI